MFCEFSFGSFLDSAVNVMVVTLRVASYNRRKPKLNLFYELNSMPIYEFKCRKCNAMIEVFQKSSDKSPTRCKKCGGRLEKMISAPAVQFKGEGWYVTDYARKGSVAEKVERELSSPEPASSNDKSKPKEKTSKTDPKKS